ncbi:MAG: hypothetical protein EZS26_002532 [Candidatus Ordinivivax streblomastigis]|uniref:TonB-dependent receptor plug domain-containing protein n=1 Tax=Candidatus Ordinivivax streblomastigis TaxID=2540710 RepID=A0A5M8NYV2_9BACT|nr:MAG: hypothetical protein EZS26_002532 [Candidatus Ordinivivax streblomastigis]
MKKRLILLVSILLTTATTTFSQELRLVVHNKPLNTVLNTLNIEISFDDKALSAYNISVSKTFGSPEEALIFLLKDKPFGVEKMSNVYVISLLRESTVKQDTRAEKTSKKQFVISGTLSDSESGESLPFAYIQTNSGMVDSNESGFFAINQDTFQPVRVQIRYMGYETLDTLLSMGNHHLSLVPQTIPLAEISVSPSPTAMLMQSGKKSGEVRINHQIARYMPGSSDNSVFNLLRMMPGVRASGEPSEDLIVWGSNTGESQLVYDGFTIFGMKNFNDQISSVNPYLAKDIRLLKGGYDASFGNRIGAIAEITGNDGKTESSAVKVNISNYTANLFTSRPVGKRSALSVAYRQTFYNLYDKTGMNTSTDEHNSLSQPEIYIDPTYDFKDLNLKYAGKASVNDHYYVSLYGADDRFNFSVANQNYEVNALEKSRQYGAAGAYNRVWNNGSSSKLLLSFSQFATGIDNLSGITDNQPTPLDIIHIDNSIQEYSLNLEHTLNVGQHQKLQIGGKWQQYSGSLEDSRSQISNPAVYVIDNISLRKLSLQAGIRADFILNDRVYIQPRLSARYAFSEELTATASLGHYNQFLTRTPFQYNSESYQLIWCLSDSTFLSSTQVLAGLAYSKNGWLFNVEGFLKKNRNELYYIDNTIYPLDNAVSGMDFYAKKEWNKHTFFGSYSLVNTAKPQAATGQEVKLGVICSFHPFYLSSTYVYGTGFAYLSTGGHGHGQENEEQEHGQGHTHSDTSTEPYSRLDLAVTYKLQLKRWRLQAGASVLNVFDTNNVKYNYRLADQNNIFNIYTKATPLTPILFMEIIF